MVSMAKSDRVGNRRPRERVVGGFGGRSARAKNAVLAAALAAVGVLVANPTYEAQAATPTATPTVATSASGEAVPIGDLPGWHQEFVDDFTVNAPLGSWGTKKSHNVVYTGDHGGKWVEYPDGWASTYTDGQPGYQPAKVLSVHDGVLDFYLHNVASLPSGANPSPLVTGKSQYQTYGRYTARIKSDTIPNYHAAWLLWPVKDNNGACAESDFPETNLGNDRVTAFAHNAANCQNYAAQDEFNSQTRIDDGAWHTYTQEWGPGFRRYYIDGRLLGTSTTRVWSQDERWQLQTEPDGAGNTAGHLLVDWVAVYAYAPVTTQSAPTPAATAAEDDEATAAKEAGSVHPGAICARPGALGSTDTDARMVCAGSPASWRSA